MLTQLNTILHDVKEVLENQKKIIEELRIIKHRQWQDTSPMDGFGWHEPDPTVETKPPESREEG